MLITFEEVKKQREDLQDRIKRDLQGLDDEITKSRERKCIPNCLTKWRVKSTESIYLKTKIKPNYNSLNDITDLGGLRVLVLFENDLLQLHKELLKILVRAEYRLIEFKLFNWDDRPLEIRLLDVLRNSGIIDDTEQDEKHSSYKYEPENPDSGYKSIHYVVKKSNFFSVEIQLRTLLQDVWGELEHSLVYKQGKINPHIDESFKRLAQELAVKDKHIQYLHDLSSSERALQKSVRITERTCTYLSHNRTLLTQESLESAEYISYLQHCLDKNAADHDRQQWAQRGVELLANLTTKLKTTSVEHLNLWRQCEKSFWILQKGEVERALKEYEHSIQLSEKLNLEDGWGYTLYYRVGEIQSMMCNYQEALMAFDKSEQLIPKDNPAEFEQIARIKLKLAYHYWIFGPEMYQLALQKSQEAKNIYELNKDQFKEMTKGFSYENNLIWYQIEVCISNYNRAKQKLKASSEAQAENIKSTLKTEIELTSMMIDSLESTLGKDSSSNEYDTASWGLYNLYKIKSDIFPDDYKDSDELLKKAHEYVITSIGKRNDAAQIAISGALQMSHLREIVRVAGQQH